IAGIPAGAVCSVSETSVPTPPTNYVFGTTPPAVPVTTTNAGPNNASFTNALTRLSSTVTIHKTITGGPAGGTAATFGYTTTCDAGGPFSTSVTTVASIGSNTITTVPAGATCTVTETTVPAAPTNYGYGTTPAPVMLTTTVAGPNNANFTNVLTRQTGTLTVAKDVAGPSTSASLVNGDFPYSVDCGADGNFTNHVTITGGVTNSGPVSTVPAGASCTVTETGMATAPAGYSWNAATYTGNPATIPANGAATVTMHNTLSALAAGSISVTKSVVGGPIPAGTFSITVACPANGAIAAYNTTQTVAGGATTVFTGVPTPNPSCTVTESATLPTAPTNYAWDLTVTPPAVQTVAVGGSATVINTLVRQTSAITVNKTVTGGPAGGVSGTFNFGVDCTASSDGTYTGAITLASATSGSTSITGVPAGANCTVSEGALPTSPTNYTWGAIPPAVTFVTTNAGPNTASFTNTLTRDPSTIEIDKSVTGGPAAGVSGAFTFTVDCTASSDGTYPGTITLTSATSGNTTVTPVPAGANCTVSEATIPTAPTGYSWGAMPANVPLTPTEAGPNIASFTNTLTRQPSTITVNKTVTGGPANGVSGAFDFSADCGTDGVFSGTIILTSATTGSIGIGVPANATCTVSETSVPPAPANYAWGATPPVVMLTTTTGTNTANFTNPLNTTYVPLNIPVPTLQSWLLMLLGAMLLLLGVYVQQRKSKD
ncbi:MAG: beta strand repeat-containing protein, partial [Rudaea sp.]